jgi:hypothetical protein
MGKGENYERDICKFFSLWITDQKRDDIFWRTSGSGGRAGHRKQKKKDTAFSAGDMTFIDPIGEAFIRYFLVEIKRGYTDKISVLGLIDKTVKGQPKLIQWWDKGEKEKDDHNRYATMLVFKRDYCIPLVAFREATFIELEDWAGHYEASPIITLDLKASHNYCLVMLPLKPCMEWFTPDIFEAIYNINVNKK